MNIPMSWLKAFVDIDCDMKSFTERITMSGSKVESVVRLGKELENVVAGKILSIEKHNNAEKLVVVKVDAGDKILQIVTGATNIKVSDYVPVALDGATLAKGVKIKAGDLRGMMSEGMLCSIQELGYDIHDYPEAPENGIYIFDELIFNEGQKPGDDVRDILMLCDDVVEYEITSNRPDCFSVFGVAREAAATFNVPLRRPDLSVLEKASGDIAEMISVEIKNPDLCPRYIARAVKNVKIEDSPLWLRHRLTASGIRPINNIVDITNYVMLELGQPMHAFDIDNIAERRIIVRNAEDNEKFITLDGEERILDSSMLVISDPEKAVAIAGVMGGENSKITGHASAILFESACFNGTNIRLTSKKLGLRTDSSSKFEKGLDPNLAEIAVNRAVHLIEELGYGEVVKGMADCYPSPAQKREIRFSYADINLLLGTDINNDEMDRILNSIEVETKNGVSLIPTFRPDLEIWADLAEEVGRLYGYDNIPEKLAVSEATVGKKSRKEVINNLTKEILVSQGYMEMLSYAFESPKVFDKLLLPSDSPLRGTLRIINPLGEDFSIMRTLTLNSVLTSLSLNYNRRNEEARLFEITKVYMPQENSLPDEVEVLTLGGYGNMDFYSVKGAVCAVLSSMHIENVIFEPEQSESFMHPGRCAGIYVNSEKIGFIGEVHPKAAENYEIGAKAYTAVVYMSALYQYANLVPQFKPLPKYPGMKRDISMIVDENLTVYEIEKSIREKAGAYLEDVVLFDVYKGDNIEKGKKSVAFSIYFRSNDKTLTEEQVSASMIDILENMENVLGITLRS